MVGYGAKVGAIPADLAIDLPMDVLFGKPPKMHRDTAHPAPPRWPEADTEAMDLRDAGLRVEMRDEILAVLETLNREGLTLVVVTHEDRVSQAAKRVLRLTEGRLVEERS